MNLPNRNRGIDAVVGDPPRTLGGTRPPHRFVDDATNALNALSNLEEGVVRMLRAFQDNAPPSPPSGSAFPDDDDDAPPRFSSLTELACQTGGVWFFASQLADYIVKTLEAIAKEDTVGRYMQEQEEKKNRSSHRNDNRNNAPPAFSLDGDAQPQQQQQQQQQSAAGKVPESTSYTAFSRFARDLEKDPNWQTALQYSNVAKDYYDFVDRQARERRKKAQESEAAKTSGAAAPAAAAAAAAAASSGGMDHIGASPMDNRYASEQQHQQSTDNTANNANKPPQVLSQHVFVLVYAFLQSMLTTACAVPVATVRAAIDDAVQQRHAAMYSSGSDDSAAAAVKSGSSLPRAAYTGARSLNEVGTVNDDFPLSGAARARQQELTSVPQYVESQLLYVSHATALCSNGRFAVLARFHERIPSYPGYLVSRAAFLARDQVVGEFRVVKLIAAFDPAKAADAVHSDAAARPASLTRPASPQETAGSRRTLSTTTSTTTTRTISDEDGNSVDVESPLSYAQLLQGQILREKLLADKFVSRALAVRHPHLASLYDVILDERVGGTFLIEASVDHGTLLPLDGEGRCDRARDICTARALWYMRQLLDALAHLHERGIVHGALSWRDVLLAPDDCVVLKSFGMLDSAISASLEEIERVAPNMVSSPEDGGDSKMLRAVPRRSQHHDNMQSPAVAGAFEHLDAIAAYCFKAPEVVQTQTQCDSKKKNKKNEENSNTEKSNNTATTMTPQQSPPEVAAAAPAAAPRNNTPLMQADVFSLGLLFHVLLFGRLPFVFEHNAAEPLQQQQPSTGGAAHSHCDAPRRVSVQSFTDALQSERRSNPSGTFAAVEALLTGQATAAAAAATPSPLKQFVRDCCRPLEEIPRAVFFILGKMLAFEPSARCTARDALEAVDAVLATRQYRELCLTTADEFRLLLPKASLRRHKSAAKTKTKSPHAEAEETYAHVVALLVNKVWGPHDDDSATDEENDDDHDFYDRLLLQGRARAARNKSKKDEVASQQQQSPQQQQQQQRLILAAASTMSSTISRSSSSDGFFPRSSSGGGGGGEGSGGMGAREPTAPPHEGPGRGPRMPGTLRIGSPTTSTAAGAGAAAEAEAAASSNSPSGQPGRPPLSPKLGMWSQDSVGGLSEGSTPPMTRQATGSAFLS